MMAADELKVKTVSVAGGVSANTRLRAELTAQAKKRGLTLSMPPLSLTGDNAAMIGAQAYYEYLAGHAANSGLNAVATLSVEKGAPEDFYI